MLVVESYQSLTKFVELPKQFFLHKVVPKRLRQKFIPSRLKWIPKSYRMTSKDCFQNELQYFVDFMRKPHQRGVTQGFVLIKCKYNCVAHELVLYPPTEIDTNLT